MSGHRLIPGTDETWWRGRKYRRFPGHESWHRRSYYMATTAPRTYLHRDIYVSTNGPIPDGWHVHHRDHDPLNNAVGNLLALTAAEHAVLHGEELERLEFACEECGEDFTATRAWARWCSPSCKERRRRREGTAYVRPRKGPMREARSCEECAGDYTARKPWARFCSSACKQRAGRRARKNEREEAS